MSMKNTNTKLAIAGAGMVGAYLFRVLKNNGHEIDVFDIKPHTRCGITPCAWGTSNGFAELVRASGLEPEDYIMRRVDHVMIDELKVKADLMTIDKPRLVEDLLQDGEINYSPLIPDRYDRIIDATGVSRAFLPGIKDDIVLPCTQCRVETDGMLENRIRFAGIGYAWCFPLSGNTHHIGCGSLFADPERVLEKTDWLGTNPSPNGHTLICRCDGRIRLTGPHGSLPFVTDGPTGGVWGVGEAIGCVAPLAGDGIVPGMRSAQILVDKWDDPEGYAQAILDEFGWMKNERRVVDKLIEMENLGINEALVLRENSKRMGMKIGFRQARILLQRLRQGRKESIQEPPRIKA
jgi:flavin-dependent dehydrogenase